MQITAVIQARVGSTRLPGKVMYPLNGKSVLEHVVKRVQATNHITNVVVVTSTEPQDDVIHRSASRYGAHVIRGSESDVLDRFTRAAEQYEPDIIVRVTGDCPLIDTQTIDTVVNRIMETESDYITNILDRTFPRGLDVEAFTKESFERVQKEATELRHREHVTPYYRENPDQFILENVTSNNVFDEEWMQNRTDLRLTLDEAADYEVLRRIYENIPYKNTLPIRKATRYVDEHKLMNINESVIQKQV